jgi:hypothetical protein
LAAISRDAHKPLPLPTAVAPASKPAKDNRRASAKQGAALGAGVGMGAHVFPIPMPPEADEALEQKKGTAGSELRRDYCI